MRAGEARRGAEARKRAISTSPSLIRYITKVPLYILQASMMDSFVSMCMLSPLLLS